MFWGAYTCSFVLRNDKSLTLVSFVKQDLNLSFETEFFKIRQKLSELWVAEEGMSGSQKQELPIFYAFLITM